MQLGIEGDIILDEPRKIVKACKDLDIPIMIGVTSQDFLPVVLYELALRWGLRNERLQREPIYAYFFDRTLPGNRFKVFHSCDLWYMFGNMEQSWRTFEEVDKRLSALMIDNRRREIFSFFILFYRMELEFDILNIDLIFFVDIFR